MNKEAIPAIKDLGNVAEIRNTDSKARFMVVDRKEILFMITDDTAVHPTYDVGIWVNTPFFANALEELFELAWKEMKPAKQVLKL